MPFCIVSSRADKKLSFSCEEATYKGKSHAGFSKRAWIRNLDLDASDLCRTATSAFLSSRPQLKGK
jgi:hypothetical protein